MVAQGSLGEQALAAKAVRLHGFYRIRWSRHLVLGALRLSRRSYALEADGCHAAEIQEEEGLED